MRSYIDLAFMGAAFLLLETKNIIQFALLFGTTWFVNSLVFAGVLLAVYLAVETARRVRLPRPAVLYGCLIASLALTWLVPQDSLLALPRGRAFPGRRGAGFRARYSSRTWSSRSGSPTCRTRGPPLPPTCSGPWSAARSSTWP